MDDERDDPTGGADNSGGSGGAGSKAKGAAQKGKWLANALKSLKTMGLLGTIFVWVIIGIVILLIVIGLIGFFLEMPSLMGDKLTEIKDSVFSTIGSFLEGNSAYITEEDQLELAEYLENMGYPPYEFGFGKLEEKDENGEITQTIDSKYLNAYLLADYNTYTVHDNVKEGISKFLNAAGGFFFGNPVGNPEDDGIKEAQFGMLYFEGSSSDTFWVDDVDIDIETKTLTLSTWDPDGLVPRTSKFTFDMNGWSARYGKPLDLSITLHLATMAPDLVYKLIMDEEENTAINIGRSESEVRIRMKYKKNTGVTSNFGTNVDESLANLDEVDEFQTEELQQIKDFIKKHQASDEVTTLETTQKNVEAFLDMDFDTFFTNKDRVYSPSGREFFYANYTNLDSNDGFETQHTSSGDYQTMYTNSIAHYGTHADAAIEAARKVLNEDGKEDTLPDKSFAEMLGSPVGVSWDEDGNIQYSELFMARNEDEPTGLMKEYYDILEKKCKEKGITSTEEFEEDTELQKELFEELKKIIKKIYDEVSPQVDTLYEIMGDDTVKALKDEMEKIGLTEDAIDRSEYYNDSMTSNEDGEQIKKMEPYLKSVTKHWYRNVYFVMPDDESEQNYIEEHYPDWTGAYTNQDEVPTKEYPFEPAEGTNDSDLAATDNGAWYVVETYISGDSRTQTADAVRGEVNQHTKELFTGTEGHPAKYFIYDGSEETAEQIDKLRKIYNDTYQTELQYYVYSNPTAEQKAEALQAAEDAVEAQEAIDGTNCFKELDVRANALSAFTILENSTSEDAEYILRDLKNLFVDLEYFTKEELKVSDTHVFQWPLSSYINPYWPQKRFEKQQRDYGTLIRSKVSTDNMRNGYNADGTERSETEEQSAIYAPNYNADATLAPPPAEEDTPDENTDGEEEDEITNPTATLEDGFEPGLNVVSPVTGEIIEEGEDYIKIKVLDNTAISEYTPFYNKYKDVCTGYIMYIRGFQKVDINADSASEYREVTHTDAYFTKYGYDQNGMEEWREDEEKRVDAPAYIERDGKRYIKEGTVIGTTTNSDIGIYLINRENSLIEDVESYILLQGKQQTNGTYFSLQRTLLSKQEFIDAVIAYASSRGADSVWKNSDALGQYYDLCLQYQINPEWTVATAVWESGLSSPNGNYWGYGTPNGASLGDFGGFIPTLEKMLKTLKEYQTEGTWYYDTIMQRYEERKACTDNGGVNPDGYGLPDSVQGIQSLYSSLGRHITGSSGSGGYYYMDPDVAGVTMIYETHQQFLSLCKNSGKAEHAYGTEVTIWENGQYTAYQVQQRIQTAKDIFGERAGQAP